MYLALWTGHIYYPAVTCRCLQVFFFFQELFQTGTPFPVQSDRHHLCTPSRRPYTVYRASPIVITEPCHSGCKGCTPMAGYALMNKRAVENKFRNPAAIGGLKIPQSRIAGFRQMAAALQAPDHCALNCLACTSRNDSTANLPTKYEMRTALRLSLRLVLARRRVSDMCQFGLTDRSADVARTCSSSSHVRR